jgi:ribonucleoside-diphosphate reductase alpha chain
MPAKIKTEGKYVHEDIKESQSSQLESKEHTQTPKSSEKGLEQTRAAKTHFDAKEHSQPLNGSENSYEQTRMASSQSTQAKTVSSASSSKPKNGNKGKLVESDNLMPLDELMKEKGYCEECGN